MRTPTFLFCLAALTVGACTTTVPTEVSRLGSTPILSGGSYSSGGGITVAADLRERSGATMVCGVWAQSRRQSVLTKDVERQVLSSGSIYLGDTRLLQNLAFMNEVAPTDDYSDINANCVETEMPWSSGNTRKTAQIRIPRQVVYSDPDGDSGVIVHFRQTGPGAEKDGFSLQGYLKDKIAN